MLVQLYDKLLKTYAIAWTLLVLGLSLTVAVAWSLFIKVRAMDENRFQRQVAQTVGTLRDRMEKYELALAGLADFAASRPNLTLAEWNHRVRLLLPEKNYPGLLELGLIEEGVNPRGAPEAPPGNPATRDPVLQTNVWRLQHAWVCPPSAYDGINPRLLIDPVIKQALLASLRSRTPSYCYRRELATEIAGKPAYGFTIFVPTGDPVANENPTNQPSYKGAQFSRLHRLQSERIVFGSIEPNLLLGTLFGTAPRELGFDLFSGQPLAAETWLNVNGPAPPTLKSGFNPYLRAAVPLAFHGQEWTLVLYTTPLFERESSRYRPWSAVVVGTILSLLVATLLLIQIRARVRHQRIAAELRSVCDDLQRVQNERERISRDIHDGAIQSLYGLQLSLGHYDRLRGRDTTAANRVLDRCRQAVDALIVELRKFLVQQEPAREEFEMSPNPAVTLQKLVDRFQTASSVPIEFVMFTPATLAIPWSVQFHLRQIAQEAISNSLRHGCPRHIKLELRTHDGHLQLRVSDDGQGFDAVQAHASGRGLANMHGRAVQLGGVLNIEGQTGRGTTITLDIPLAS